jgi:hypothetical protein
MPMLRFQLTMLLFQLACSVGPPFSAVAARALWAAQLMMLGVCAGWRSHPRLGAGAIGPLYTLTHPELLSPPRAALIR